MSGVAALELRAVVVRPAKIPPRFLFSARRSSTPFDLGGFGFENETTSASREGAARVGVGQPYRRG